MTLIPTESDPYVPIANLRRRVDYQPEDFFSESHNATKRFDELLGGSQFVDNPEFGDDFAGLEAEARGIINTRTGDQTFHEQLERVDRKRAPDNATLKLPYPIQQIREVEFLRLRGDTEEWETLENRHYTSDRYYLILRRGSQYGDARGHRTTTAYGSSHLSDNANRRNWDSIGPELRITYDRGYETIPAEIRNIVVRLVNQMLRNLNMEEGIAATSPEESNVFVDASTVVTEEIEKDIANITHTASPVYTV